MPYSLENILPYLVPLFIIIFFSLMIRRRSTLEEVEKQWPARYQTICSARIGGLNYSWPFTRLAIYENFLVIKSWKTQVINFEQITNIKLPIIPLMAGIQINYKEDGKDRTTLIYVLKSEPLLQALEGKVSITK